MSMLSQRIHHDMDPNAERKLVLQQLHDAAQIGDVDTVKNIFDSKEIHINITRKGRNTTLHTALMHNQEGPLIDYLIQNGADTNIENTKGYCPLTLAIIHCKESKAVEKLIAAGVTWEKFERGAFSGLSALDVAIKYNNEKVVCFLKLMTETGICKEVTKVEPKKGRSICPVCQLQVKFPTHMSRIEADQEAIEKGVLANGEYGAGKHKRKKYLTRKYMDQLLAHSNGESCSGKGITTALCGALDKEGSNNYFLAVDKLLPHSIPHFLHGDKQIQYLCRDIMVDEMFTELEEIVRHQTQEQGRTPILVGMHLCGLLSERAIEFFERIPEIGGIVLSPCCLPKKHEQRTMSFSKGKSEDGELGIYFKWSNYLKEMVEGVVLDVRSYTDEEMHSEKNSIIVGVRK
ncbi:hypothetical protein ACHAXR_010976 [Thalassiosira sp. AJA248-18]